MKINALSQMEYEMNRGFGTMYRKSSQLPLSLHILNDKFYNYIYGANPSYFTLGRRHHNRNRELNLEELKKNSMAIKLCRTMPRLSYILPCFTQI